MVAASYMEKHAKTYCLQKAPLEIRFLEMLRIVSYIYAPCCRSLCLQRIREYAPHSIPQQLIEARLSDHHPVGVQQRRGNAYLQVYGIEEVCIVNSSIIPVIPPPATGDGSISIRGQSWPRLVRVWQQVRIEQVY